MYQSYTPPIYGNRWEEFMRSERNVTPESERLDHATVKFYMERLGRGTALRVGFAKAIFDGMFYVLDPDHYDRAAKEVDGEIWAPAPYVCKYFGEEFTPDANGYVNLTAICKEKEIPTQYFENGLFTVTPKPVRPFDAEENAGFIKRIAFAFEDPQMPEPKYNNAEQTRIEIARSEFPTAPKGDDYDWFHKPSVDLYSPALLITKDKEGKKVYYISHERGHITGWTQGPTETVLLRSYDEGKTCEEIAVSKDSWWAFLFEVKGRIYLCGTVLREGERPVLKMARLEDDDTLTESIIDTGTGTWTNPNAHLVKNGKIYLPTFPVAICANEDADLLDPASWVCSNNMKDFVTREWFQSETGIAPEQLEDFWPLESNVIPCTDGKLRCLLRLETIPYAGYTLLLEMSDDGKVLKLDERCNGLVEMPTTISKFKVCYDEGTGLYLALANVPSLPIPYSTRGSTPMSGQRNQLALVASPDLINWKTIDVVLTDRAVMNASASARAHGFQYVIWDVDGDDMVFVVREAYGNTKTYHDGGAVTLYRLADYQKLVKERYPQEEFWKNPSRKK